MRRAILVTVMSVVLGGLAVTGCQQEQKTAKSAQVAVKKYVRATTLEGRVSNNQGPVKAGRVEAMDENGRLIADAAVDNGHYSIDIPADTVLPIVLTFAAGAEEKLFAAVVHDTITQYDINPSSTAIAKAAKAMGGYTHANMTRAAADTVHTPDANKTTTGWRGDPTTQYGGWH